MRSQKVLQQAGDPIDVTFADKGSGALDFRLAAIGQQAIAISGLAARRGGRAAGRCAGAHGNLGIECVGRLGLNSLLAEASARCR